MTKSFEPIYENNTFLTFGKIDDDKKVYVNKIMLQKGKGTVAIKL